MKTSLLSWSMVLVATALVACGDDSETTGAGGAGGDATASTGTPSSTSPSSGPTSTSSGTPASSGSSSDGGGGSGQGGSAECITVSIPEVTPDGNTIGGLLDPSTGGAAEDYGITEFWDVDAAGDPLPILGSAPGVYDLSEEADYLTCGHCVVAYEDVDGEGAPTKFYFQESGTLEVAEEGNAILSGYGTVTYTNVVLREVEIDTEAGTTTFVEGGSCIILEDFVYDNPNPAPEGWTCDPSFYGDEEGCDCYCGVTDIDCDDPDQEVLGCEGEQTCSDPWDEEAACVGDVPNCDAALPIVAGAFLGTTADGLETPHSTCGTGGSAVFSYTAGAAGLYTFTVVPGDADFDVTLSVRADCDQLQSSLPDESEAATGLCGDDEGDDGESILELTLTAGQVVTVVVTAFDADTEGAFTGTVTGPG